VFNLVDCRLKASLSLIGIYIGVFFCVSYSVAVAQIGVFEKVICYIVICCIFVPLLRARGLLITSESITGFSWSVGFNQFYLSLKCGEQLEVLRIHKRVVTPFFVFLKVDVNERLFSVPLIVFFDSCNQESFRRLKVLAKYASHKQET